MDSPETAERIEEARQGSRVAFADLVRSHQEYAYAVAFRLLWDAVEAEDVVQEAFVRIWQNLSRFDPDRRFTTWMYAIVANLCRDRLRGRRRRPLILDGAHLAAHTVDPGADLDGAIDARDLRALIQHLSDRLPLRQRMVFALRDLQDLGVAEVAAILGISKESVKTNLHLARRKLRRILADEHSITGVGV